MSVSSLPSALEESVARAWRTLRGRRVLALTGAGCSTDSGIPDYRDEAGAWKRSPPVQYRDFVRSESVRRRYWARSFAGWPRMADAEPNTAHRALAQLEAAGHIQALITQNVDGLHQKAGQRAVIDLHGRIDGVVCLECATPMGRAEFQQRLAEANPGWRAGVLGWAPDGDADLEADAYAAFGIPACPHCKGVLKPAVVFFGEHIPADTNQAAATAVAGAEAVLVVGSSLMVWSGYRLVRAAAERGIPVVAVNRGQTRADALIDLKIDAPCGPVLERVAAHAV